MDDGCLLRNNLYLGDSLLLYVCFVDSVSQFTWPRLAAPIGGEAAAGMLRSAAVRAAHVCSAFMVVRFIGDMRQMPWALCIGDIDSNLICLTPREGEISKSCCVQDSAVAAGGFQQRQNQAWVDVA